jgi:hypothetical protein
VLPLPLSGAFPHAGHKSAWMIARDVLLPSVPVLSRRTELARPGKAERAGVEVEVEGLDRAFKREL